MSARIDAPAPRTLSARDGDRARTFDLLGVPGLGTWLRRPGARLALQIPVFLLAIAMIAHGFLGPDLAPKNLAPLLTWVHFRGLVVLSLLLVGNLFCMACPFMVPRAIARRFFRPRLLWPRALRNKWPAVFAFVGVLFAYELFDLFATPWWTAVLILAYFAAAWLVDALFSGAAFCKYVCPIGQFNFLGSTLSPLEVSVSNPDVCASCTTRDCIRGRGDPSARPDEGTAPERDGEVRRGCELHLFVPSKVDNIDCTFCLDCVHACPHENIGLLARVPGARLGHPGSHPGVGRLDRRTDFTALVIVFVFGALLNAFAMVSPVYALEAWLAAVTGISVEWPILAAIFIVGLVLEPLLLLGGAALVTRRAGVELPAPQILQRFVSAFIPLGFGIWLGHYGFHFFTGVWTAIPVAQYAVSEALGRSLLGEPRWQLSGMPAAYVFPIELAFLGLGLCGSMAVAWRIACQVAPAGRERHVFLPWAVVAGLVVASAYWTLLQPMEMRGTFLGG